MKFKYILIIIFGFLILSKLSAQDEVNPASSHTRIISTTLPFFNEEIEVAVSEIGSGVVIFDGDIVVTEGSEGGRGGAVINESLYRWPNSTIPYIIEANHPKTSDLEWAINQLNNNTNLCMRPKQSTDNNWVKYIIDSSSDYCGYSRVGKKIGVGEQEISITTNCSNARGSAIHETMHAAGFYHEQTRTDRDNYVTIHLDRVHPEEYRNNFIIEPETTQNVGTYDYQSIMHYPRNSFGRNTIVPKQKGVRTGQRQRLSPGDITSINSIYSPSRSCVTSSADSNRGGDDNSNFAGYESLTTGQIDIQYTVELVPQRTGMSCWAAGAAMIVGWKDKVCIDPEEIVRSIGYWQQYQTGLDACDTTMFAVWGLTVESPMSYTVDGFANLLASYGPLWVASADPGPHIRVITGIRGDGTPDGTILTINDPWQTGMRNFRMPNSGSTYTETYAEFERKQHDLARREMKKISPIYIAHL